MNRSTPLASLHIIGSKQAGGAERFFLRLVQQLHEHQQPVTVIVRSHSYVHQALADTGIPLYHLPFINIWDYWTRFNISRLIRRLRPQIVQTYMGRATRLTHNPNSDSVHIARLGGYYKIDGYYRHADAWIGNTREICTYLEQSGLPSERVFHIGNFVPEANSYSAEDRKAFLKQHNVPESAQIVFALGRLTEKKGFADLLHAFAQLPEHLQNRPVFLMIAGDGPQSESLHNLCHKLNINSRVRWLGWLQDPGLAFSTADLFVCPSRHEPLGNVILEAWSYQVPVLSTDNQGATELITENHNGVLTPCQNPDMMAHQLQTLLQADLTFLNPLAEAGLNTLKTRFDPQQIMDQYLHLYQQMNPSLISPS